MEPLEQKAKITTSVLTTFMFLLLVTGAYYWRKSWKLTKQNDQNELRADSLLSVKLRLEGDIRSLVDQFESTVDANESLDKRITHLHTQIGRQDMVISNLHDNNRTRSFAIQRLTEDTTALSIKCDSMENQLAAVLDKTNWLSENNKLQIQQNQVLQQQVDRLTATLQTKVSPSAITADAFFMEATKANRKETAKAKKVRTLVISFHISSELPLTGVQEVYLSLVSSQNMQMIPALRTTTISLADSNEVIPIHAEQGVDFSHHPQRIAFSLTPNRPMKPGHYRASVFTKDRYLGAVEFQFRDSFLFF
jgi:uncharacterized coiled-coil protein SlyX